jgi:hypothetical protein
MATVRRPRNLVVLAVSCAVLASAVPASAVARTAHRHRTLGGCGALAGSAIHEYCEAIPSETGGSVPKVGSPSVATTLPTPIVRALNAGPVAERKLLTLPAAHKRHKRAKVRTASLNDPSSGWSLSLLIILILVAIALALAGGAAERWRRSRT